MDGRSKFAARKSIFILFLLILFLQGKLLAQVGFYWEQPEIFSAKGSFPVSASNGEFSVIAWQESSGSDSASEGDGRISISLGIKIAGEEWQLRRNIGEPFTYSGTEPSILSIALDHEGRIIIAVAVSTTQTEILISGDQGKNFSRYWIDSGNENSVAPRIVVRSDGGYLLFVTRSFEASLSIYYSRSDDGINWTPFDLFVDDAGLQLNFLPTHAANGSFDYVVFQSFVAGSGGAIPSFQLFIKMSYDGCKTWTQSRRLTTFRDPVSNTSAEPERFDNQRPHLIPYGDWLFLVWERRFGTGSPQIYSAILDTGANIIGQANRVNNINAYCNYPVAFLYQGSPMVVWFDNRRGSNRAFLAQQTGAGIGGGNWQNYDLSGNVGDTSFARPMVNGDDLYVFWQITSRGGQRAPETSRIYYLLPDTSVNPPLLAAQNFIPSRRGRGERVRLSWTADDPSGIAGFAWLWSRNENEDPPRELMIHTDTAAIQTSGAAINTPGASSFMDVNALDDGSWYFSLIAQDFAGNWSSPARIEYIRDTTPPPAATIIFPEIDERGFLLSNTFSLKWNPPPASDIAGYTWELQYMGSAAGFPGNLMGEDFNSAAAEHFSRSVSLTPRIIGPVTIASYVNQDNGIWRFTVAAIDEVGNVGPQSSLFFKTDKYIPHTYVTYVDANQDEQGILSIHIIGRGFSNGGNVSRIFLDQDGAPPYDKEFIFSRGDYQVNSDREITGLQIEDISEGTYRLVLEHPLRGLHITGSIVTADKIGTVKFGDFSRAWEASWRIRKAYRFMLEPGLLIIFAILVLCVIGLFASVRGLGNVIADSAAVRIEAAALLTGDFMPLEKKRRLVKIKRRGIGLRLKLASFTVALVLLVVAMVSAPLYYMMTVTQRETLLQGLWDRSTVLLEGLASSARAYMPSGNVLELGFLPAQTAAIPEARYITITGYSSTTIFDDHVWATNDPDILSKIDTAEFQPGISRLNDILSSRLEEINRNLNERARTEVGSLSQSITQMTQEAISLALHTDPESRQRLRDIQVTTRSLETRLTERLTEIAREIGSEPAFSTENLSPDGNRSFIFFKPVMYRHGAEDTYLRGLIRLEVSIDAIINEIAEGQRSLLEVILLIALAAIIIGTIGALILSMVIIRPIRRLVSHVEQIRDTEDKSKLEGVEIAIKTRDEIAVLGNTINDMTHGLVKAAAAASDLSIGKEIQKKFIPLELDRNGNKLSSGYKDTKNAHFFGYYEGAKGVSGDYFDYQDLDGRYYAIIKCDVAGKGIPAALIMIQVATMFLNYFKQWKPTAKGMHIEEVVYQINDFIETLGFKGRFAAFTLCLFDSQTGILRFCNAGDNIIHLFDASEKQVKTIYLRETPATGVLPNVLVESKGGYKVETLTIDPGDILLLYTDGIEEAKRRFRDSEFREIFCTEGPNDTPHENHSAGQGDEEMGANRVQAIINAVMNRQLYTLHKWHNPEATASAAEDSKDLSFDFTACEGKVEEVIMALVSVEKMFRCYKDPKATDDNRVLVDKKVDEFLKVHFLQYRNYCSYTRENPGNDAYMYYTHVREDDQYDDLTILGIKRK